LQRNVTALIDWFTLLFFTGCGLIIWVVWIAMQTGVPAQPAANVRRLLPGFEPSFTWLAFLAALAATIAWGWLVVWRAGRHRDALWKSLVLPAGGAAMSWLLLMTLWMPLLNFARSDVATVRQITRTIPAGDKNCVAITGLSQSDAAALSYHGNLHLVLLSSDTDCPWLITGAATQGDMNSLSSAGQWRKAGGARRRSSDRDDWVVYRRVTAPAVR
jgi:4-amino-4-deoxy-L-arabinose transferase-like glycosyltransferase